MACFWFRHFVFDRFLYFLTIVYFFRIYIANEYFNTQTNQMKREQKKILPGLSVYKL